MNWKLPTLAGILLLSACSSSRDVVQNGPFQHRKYVNKGWFLDLPSAHKAPKVKEEAANNVTEAVPAEEARVMDVPATEPTEAIWTPEPLELSVAPIAATDDSAPVTIAGDAVAPPAAPMASTTTDAGYGMRASLAKKVGAATARIPAMMAPRGDDVGGINIFALLGFIFAFLLPLAGLILSLIGMHQTSPGDGHGHGLAVAGLIISIIGMIIVFTVIL